jgi:hypothetical protein
MPARAPLDVDLEDKLLYGLTPMRLGYAVIALLSAFALWSSRWAPVPVRAVACLLVLGAGATLAWGRWRGRAVDGWLTDIAAFIPRTRRVVWNEHWADRTRWRPKPFMSTGAPASGLDSGDEPAVAGNMAEEGDDPHLDAIDHATEVALPDAAVATT